MSSLRKVFINIEEQIFWSSVRLCGTSVNLCEIAITLRTTEKHRGPQRRSNNQSQDKFSFFIIK
jgi:hypothetical protein